MHRPRHQLLARAGLAQDRHRGGGRRHPLDHLQELPQSGLVADDAVKGRLGPLLGDWLEEQLCLSHSQRGVQRDLRLEETGPVQERAVGGVQVHHVEARFSPRHLQVPAGDEPILDHQGVGGILAEGEAVTAELVDELGGALLHAHLGGRELFLQFLA